MKPTFLLVKLQVVLLSAEIISAGILDPFNWARADRLEVNIPWLPCKFFFKLLFINIIGVLLLLLKFFKG